MAFNPNTAPPQRTTKRRQPRHQRQEHDDTPTQRFDAVTPNTSYVDQETGHTRYYNRFFGHQPYDYGYGEGSVRKTAKYIQGSAKVMEQAHKTTTEIGARRLDRLYNGVQEFAHKMKQEGVPADAVVVKRDIDVSKYRKKVSHSTAVVGQAWLLYQEKPLEEVPQHLPGYSRLKDEKNPDDVHIQGHQGNRVFAIDEAGTIHYGEFLTLKDGGPARFEALGTLDLGVHSQNDYRAAGDNYSPGHLVLNGYDGSKENMEIDLFEAYLYDAAEANGLLDEQQGQQQAQPYYDETPTVPIPY